jgi:UDP-N-acetylmuramate dehydrogenase
VTDVLERIKGIAGVAARENEMLSLHTTFGVGGPCDMMVLASTEEALREVLSLARAGGIATFVLGRGSNLLVRDGGIKGIVVRLVDELARIELNPPEIRAGGGANLADLVSKATSAGIGGLEFLAGVPGTVGGAAVTNAGARDDWFGDRLVELRAIDSGLGTVKVKPIDMHFGYRTSAVPGDWIVTEATLKGHSATVEEARHHVEAYLEKRRGTQPLGERSAGCVFRNPPGDYAGRLIENAGLKGASVGGAQVSTVHANFIVNTGDATAKAILDLVDKVRTAVRRASGVDLELEINVVGKD